MKTLRLGKNDVEIYDSIEDLPIMRFHKYNKMLLVDSGIGSDLADFDRHIEKAMQFVKNQSTSMAITELENMRQNVYFIQSNLSPRCLAFAVLVTKINGEECNDISDEALHKIVQRLGNVPIKELTAQLDAVKKKIDEELRLYFPKVFEDATIKEYFDQLRRRTIVILETVISGETTEAQRKEIDNITGELITYFAPHNFIGSESAEIKHDKQFEKMCLLLSQNLHVDPKKFTVIEYYNAFEYMQEEAKRAKGQNKAK